MRVTFAITLVNYTDIRAFKLKNLGAVYEVGHTCMKRLKSGLTTELYSTHKNDYSTNHYRPYCFESSNSSSLTFIASVVCKSLMSFESTAVDHQFYRNEPCLELLRAITR